MIGAGQPFGVSKKLSYSMSADRYTGRVLYVTFTTATDLNQWLPPPLISTNPHIAFLKIYQLKRRPEDGTPLPPAFSHYHEACITVLAGPPGEPERHYNLFMWVDRDWATYKAREALGWPKKFASIDITETYPDAERYDRDVGTNVFAANVSRYGYQLIDVKCTLDPAQESQPIPPFNGFYTVRHLPPPVDGTAIRELLVIETRDGWFSQGTFGSGSIEFFDAPDEELRMLGAVEVTGCVLRDVGWVLPAWPARLHTELEEWKLMAGEAMPSKEIST